MSKENCCSKAKAQKNYELYKSTRPIHLYQTAQNHFFNLTVILIPMYILPSFFFSAMIKKIKTDLSDFSLLGICYGVIHEQAIVNLPYGNNLKINSVII